MPLPPQWNEENCEKVGGYVEEAERGADQAHVVVLRKPADDDGGSVGVESGDDRVHVAMEVGDGDHDAFGEGGAAVVEIDFLHDKPSNKRAVSSQRDTARPDVPLLYMKGGDKTMFIDKIYKYHLKY